MDDTDKSKFNMGIAMLQRIDSLINQMTIHALNENYSKWFNYLVMIDNQISYTYKDTEDEPIKSKDIEFRNTIPALLESGDKEMIYSYLLAYEEFIRSELTKRDMLIATKSDVRRAILDY